ncbi:MAG TPA: acetylxylan esterase [Gemmataceae bacterium]|jgi:dienelactone hydrolase|nr:acetylxylan esterase [Gemmataceae bacterium]
MSRKHWLILAFCCTALAASAQAAEKPDLKAILGRQIIGPHQTLTEIQDYTETRIPRMPQVKTVAEWEKEAGRLRAGVLERVVYRGAAAAWRDAATGVKWLQIIKGGPGYHIKKLRYEALPGLWIPALLYEPEKLSGKVPAVLNVNGHDPLGKAAKYKQIRCINQAKRGMLALNVEWLGMGQLHTDNFHHGRMNQIDLCGSSGLAPFYLAMKRGLDVLLALPNADPSRVAVTGLSGGGWQTIFISSLDRRVKLTDPVAGYSGLRTHVHHFKDLGDSEQAPCDLATVADYTHLTAMMAPRPTLLTYNAKDDCCFEAGYALPPLLKAAGPVFKLYGQEANLRSHVNHDPGTHNYEKDNRQALYRMLGDHFYAGDAGYRAAEIACDGELKSKEALTVELPARNADFHSLALELSRKLPRERLPDVRGNQAPARKWQQRRRSELRQLVRAREYTVTAAQTGSEKKHGLRVSYWRLKLGNAWTVPVVELVAGNHKDKPQRTVILISDAGRAHSAGRAERLLGTGCRVVAVDLFYFGEAKVQEKDYLFALLLAVVGDRPLGLQASQLAAVARWSHTEHPGEPPAAIAEGPRSSTIALVAAGLEEKAIGSLELHDALGSLKEVIEQNRTVEQTPELFCFGLAEGFDVRELAALSAPRPVVFSKAGARARSELAPLKPWYAALGVKFEPLP